MTKYLLGNITKIVSIYKVGLPVYKYDANLEYFKVTPTYPEQFLRINRQL